MHTCLVISVYLLVCVCTCPCMLIIMPENDQGLRDVYSMWWCVIA